MLPEKFLKSNDIDFPDGEVDEQYALKYAKAAWSSFNRMSGFGDWSLWRLYGAGNQPADIYATWVKNSKMFPREVQQLATQYNVQEKALRNFMRKGWKSVDFSVISFIPKLKSIIKSALMEADYNIKAYAIDPYSRDTETEKKWNVWVESLYGEYLNSIRELFGIEGNDMPVIPESLEELQLIENMEGFKSNWAIAMEKLARVVFEMSGYEKQKEMWIDDLLDGGMMVSKDDVVNGYVVHKYIDPAEFIIQYSQYETYDDAQYAGHIEYVSAKYVLHKVGLKYYDQIKTAYAGEIGNLPESEWGKPGIQGTDAVLEGYFGKVAVLNLSFITNAYDYYREFKYNGRVKIKKIPKPQQIDKSVTYQLRPMLYSLKWVIGTDVVYDYGPVYNQPQQKDNNRMVRLDYHVYSLPYKSLVRQLMPLEDEYMKGWLIYQNGVNNGFKSGVALNTTFLRNVSLNGVPAKVEDVLEFYKEEGTMPMSYSQTGDYRGGAVTPVVPIQGVAEMVINEAVNRRSYVASMIYEITGINPSQVLSAQTGGVMGEKELKYDTLINVLKPIATGILTVKESIAKNAVARIQNLIAYDDKFRKRYGGVLSNIEVNMLKEAEKNGVYYSVSLKAKPTRENIAELMQALTTAYQSQLLDPSDYMLVMEQLSNDVELGRIRQYVSYKVNKNRERMERQQQQLISMRNQGMTDMIMANGQVEMAKIEKKVEGKLAEIQLEMQKKYEGELAKEREITNREIEKVVRKIMASYGR